MSEYRGLPVAGYTPQFDLRVAKVNENKAIEERVLRRIDALESGQLSDKRWAEAARTHIEEGFMALNRALFQPARVKLEGDDT